MTEPDHRGNGRHIASDSAPASVSRRALLRGSAAAVPAIMTLHSGAALARSSNLISPAGHDAKDRLGRTLCMDLNSVYPAGRSGKKYDLGEPAYARVFAINNRDYRAEPRLQGRRVGEAEVCQKRGPVYYRNTRSYHQSDWQEVNVPQGIVVSATALRSFAGRISVTNI